MAQPYRSIPSTPGKSLDNKSQETAIDIGTSPQPNHRGYGRQSNASPEPLRPQVPPSVMAATPTTNRQRNRTSQMLAIPDRSISTGNSMSPTSQGIPMPENSSRKRPRPFSVRQSAVPRKGTIVLHPMQAEPDDYLHIPDRNPNARARYPTWRGCINVCTLAVIAMALMMLFLGYPLLEWYRNKRFKMDVNTATKEADDSVPQIPIRGLIDSDTPANAKTRKSDMDGSTYNLVFSDEFNTPGRTFWPGDDPYWEAVDIWYGATFDFEWYTPEGVYTATRGDKGVLEFALEEQVERGQFFRSGMIQSWNKFCFQGGYIEAAIQFPATSEIQGYWPGFWLMGNLGRPGYLASADGMWPYVYEDCDVGIMPNQTDKDGKGPYGSVHGGTSTKELSILPGMRLPSCTCKGEDHPGPNNGVARSAPEIDICELQVQKGIAGKGSYASQSYQVAPFDSKYKWKDKHGYEIHDEDITEPNSWSGGHLQEALSSVTRIDDSSFENASQPTYNRLGVEYEPDWDNSGGGYITFYANGKPSWTINPKSLSPDSRAEISRRVFSKEPMSIILNLGIAEGFQHICKFFFPFTQCGMAKTKFSSLPI